MSLFWCDSFQHLRHKTACGLLSQACVFVCVCLWERHLSVSSDKQDLSCWWQTWLSFLLVRWNWWGNQLCMRVTLHAFFCATVQYILCTQMQHVCIVKEPQSTLSCNIMILRPLLQTWKCINQLSVTTHHSVLQLFFSLKLLFFLSSSLYSFLELYLLVADETYIFLKDMFYY